MRFLLYDNSDNKNTFLSKQIENCIKVHSPKSEKLYIQWFRGCISVLKLSADNDTIVCWYDFQAVLCFWICKMLFLRRNIVCLNILLKDKPTRKNKLVSLLYKRALLSNNFKASVTSEVYGIWLNRKLGINVEYTLLHDVYHKSYEYKYKKTPKNNTVFCGGRNGRDWDFMIKVAESMPNVQFDMIMPKDVYIIYEGQFTPNICAKFDVTYDEFMKTLCDSSLVCLPLDTEAPAGLIVMFQAAANHKMVITTNTVTTVEYINKDRGVLLENSIIDWSKTIEYYLNNEVESTTKAECLYYFLKTECSEDKFVEGIKSMLHVEG